ncbi:MAG: hypothetical protein AAF456_14790 [Planctomycetota bacterium]
MSDSNNPFHLWLGLPQKATNPNHYQLLELKSSERDSSVIKAAAQKRLNQLKEVDPGANSDAHARVIDRVKRAFKVLSDETLRGEYDAKLRLTVEKARKKRAAASAGQPEPVSDVALPPQSVAAVPTATPVASPAQPEIPMAMPVAAISQPAAPDTEEGREVADVSKLKSLRTKSKKKSNLVPILATVFCLAGIAGIAFTVHSYGFLSQAFEEENALPQDVLDALEEERRNAGDGNRDPSSSPLSSVNESTDGESGDEDPDADAEEGPSDEEDIEPETTGNGEDDENTDPVVELLPELDFAQEIEYRCALQRARSAMYRRDKPTAERELERAISIFDGLDPERLPPKAKLLKEVAESDQQVKVWLEGFWQQVVKSATALGTTDVEAGGTIVSLVEGTDKHCIFRINGRNMTYSYEMLPPGLAMAVAEMGAKDDVPTWRLQKAAFYAVHLHIDELYGEKAVDFARTAARDGHDASPIENVVLNLDLEELGVPRRRREASSPRELREPVRNYLAEAGFRRVNRMSRADAENAFDTLFQKAIGTEEPDKREIALEAAYLVAVRSADVRNAIDVLNELNYWFEVPLTRRAETACIEVAETDLDERTALILLSESISIIRALQGAELEPDEKFAEAVFSVGEEFNFGPYVMSQLEPQR